MTQCIAVRTRCVCSIRSTKPGRSPDPASGIYGYDVGDIAADEWLNSKDFNAGSYRNVCREAVVGFPSSRTRLEMVTSDPIQANQTVNVVGSF